MNHHPEEIEQMWYNKGYNQAIDDAVKKVNALVYPNVFAGRIEALKKKVD